MTNFDSVVIFGGSGYIGGYITNYLIENGLSKKVILADIKEPRREVWIDKVSVANGNGTVQYQYCDVREKIDLNIEEVSFIFNLAAIHREPGHEPIEYFETNIKGAENINEFAENMKCDFILFTSSIAPYGHSEDARTEKSPVVPYSPYGSSKLVAEKIHQGWRKIKPDCRKLIIVRPGVIYGPHEDGNVPRLRDALKKNMFCYVGNKKVQKAGGYVKELVRSIFWTVDFLEQNNKNEILFNFSTKIPPTLEQYVDTIKEVCMINPVVPNIPYSIVYGFSNFIHFIASVFNINQPIHPERVKKLKVNNIIIPEFLVENGYDYEFTLYEAFEDWKNDVPKEW